MGLIDRIRGKAWIPPLTSFGIDYDDTTRINNYSTKSSQVEANVGWVFAANDIISETCAGVDLKLYRKSIKGERVEVDKHDILDLLDNPNGALTGQQLKQLHFTYMNLVGESYLLKVNTDPASTKKLPDAIHILPAQQVDVEIKPVLSESVVRFSNNTYTFEQVLRDINPDPRNPYKGRSVVSAAAATIDTDEQSKKWNRKLFANSARPSAVIEVPENMENEAYKRFKSQFTSQYTGTDNAGKPIIIEGGATIKPMMFNQRELDYLNSRKFSKDEILAMFKVSPAMLGMTENVNRSNMEAAEYNFAKYVVEPRLRQYVNMLNTRLVKPYDPTLELDYENTVPADKTHDLAVMEKATDKWMTIDEVRAENGLAPLPNKAGEVLYRPMNEVALGSSPLINNALTELEQVKEQKSKLEKTVLTQHSKLKAAELKKKYIYGDSKEREQIGEARVATMIKRASDFELTFKVKSRNHFEAQKKETLQNIRNIKKNFKKTGITDLVPDFDLLRKAFVTELVPVYRDLMETQGKEAQMLVNSPEPFDIEDPEVVTFYEQRAETVSVLVDEETEKQLRASLVEGLRDKENIAQLSARAEQVFGAAGDYRANRIARTESIRTANQADIMAWSQAGYIEGKEWYTSQDQRVCYFCADMDGKVLGITENYFEKDNEQTVTFKRPDGTSGTQTQKFKFEDIAAPPNHPNCRCGLLPVFREI